jgi:hypothetical protein
MKSANDSTAPRLGLAAALTLVSSVAAVLNLRAIADVAGWRRRSRDCLTRVTRWAVR